MLCHQVIHRHFTTVISLPLKNLLFCETAADSCDTDGCECWFMFSRNVRSEQKTAVDEYRYTDTDKKKKNQYCFLFNLVDFGHLFSWFPVFLMQDEARPACCISPVLFLALWNSLLSQVQGPAHLVQIKPPWQHAADISDCSHRVLKKRNVLVLVKKTVSTNVCCVCVASFVLYFTEEKTYSTMLSLFVPSVKGRVWCKNVYRKFPFV